MQSFVDLIDAFTVERLEKALGVTRSHVRVMRARNSIPPKYWPSLIANAPDHIGGKIDLDTLVSLRSGAPRALPALQPEGADA